MDETIPAVHKGWELFGLTQTRVQISQPGWKYLLLHEALCRPQKGTTLVMGDKFAIDKGLLKTRTNNVKNKLQKDILIPSNLTECPRKVTEFFKIKSLPL